MDYAKNVTAHIEQFHEEKKPKKKDKYRKYGAGHSTYYKIKSGDLNINLKTLIDIAEYLGITVVELLSAPEEEKPPVPDELECVIENFSHLTQEELELAMDSLKRTIDFYRIGRERREAGEKPLPEHSIAAGSIQGEDGLV